MPVILNFSNGSVLPENELEALRHIARSNQNDTITIGSRNMRLHYIQFMDGFSVEPIPGGLRDRLGARETHHLADSLTRQLNGGNTFLQAYSLYLEQSHAAPLVQESVIKTLLDRINLNAFPVSLQDFSCTEEYLNCPITLHIPETGVFVRNALSSEICALYDQKALTELIRRNALHPFSREPFSPEMIIRKETCHFNIAKQCFCAFPIYPLQQNSI
ncbi:DUF1076 domain-containing protein [Escherichia coli]|nr:DUF1076 domain-containing protein [Escherichia coli]EHC3885089.1 DUF1076 domain-containing protein [Escherichia coli]